MRLALALALGALLLQGCGAAVRSSVKGVRPVPPAALLKTAKAQLGKPYKYGGRDPKTGFDCSGLVWYCFHKHGSELPRSAREMYRLGSEVDRDELRPADLVFFDTEGPSPGHVGFYVGKGRFLHAPSKGKKVSTESLDNRYWKKAWVGARRID